MARLHVRHKVSPVALADFLQRSALPIAGADVRRLVRWTGEVPNAQSPKRAALDLVRPPLCRTCGPLDNASWYSAMNSGVPGREQSRTLG